MLQPPPKAKKSGAFEDNEDEIKFDDMEDGEEAEDDSDDEELLVIKKKLDLLVEYLRRVFNFCLFCVFESDSVHELIRKCPGGHLRRPRAGLSRAAKAAARASALGEPFPNKKDGKENGVEEGEADDQKQGKRFNKTEQQLKSDQPPRCVAISQDIHITYLEEDIALELLLNLHPKENNVTCSHCWIVVPQSGYNSNCIFI